jgi:class 3 adenylate cyclase/tetratricopeptide (TPR) repeat protein
MKCPRCQQESPSDADFCPECGAKLATVCTGCGTANAPSHKFCKKCGQALAAPAGPGEATPPSRSPSSYTPKHLAERIINSKAALEGERKQVTVLFADLKGSMELLADRDPEEARKLLDPVLELMMEAVHRYEGTVNQVMGDGIMALFGAPVAHEDHAVRACYAALSMQDLVRRYAADARRLHGVNVQIRVGLNSGEVVVRAIGSDLRMDYTAVGQTTHLAARMEQVASPGSVLVTPATLELVEGYVAVSPLGPVAVKGFPDALEVYEVTGAGSVRTRLQASAARGLTQFVGRAAEVERLRQAEEQASQGHGQVVAVVGEPGVGKSRLFYEFTRSHRFRDWLVLQSDSVSYGKATPYLPVLHLLKNYFKIGGRDDVRGIRAKVTGNVLTLDGALKNAVTPALWLLDALPPDDPFLALDPQERRQQTLEGLKCILLSESRVQPLLLVFEDLHWIDSETEAFLDGIIESLPTARLLLLINYRPEYRHPWGGKTYYTQLPLDPLPPGNAEELLRGLIGTDSVLQPLKRLLIERTEGNPFFLEESVRTLVEIQVLAGARGAYRLARAFSGVRVPATVQTILAARIDRLPAELKQLLQTAAVVGQDVPLVLLERVADVTGEPLRQGLAELRAAEFLFETSLFPELEYTFKHALTHEVAYASLLGERRRALHARIVDAVERLYPDRPAEHVERLAHHAVRGELWEKALAYLPEAAARAVGRGANTEAASCFEQALHALGHLPENRARLEQSVDLRLELRNALTARLVDLPRSLEWLSEAETIARRLGDQQRLARVFAHKTHSLWLSGEAQQASEAGHQALALATAVGDFALIVAGRQYLGQVYRTQGDYPQATALFRSNISALDGPQRAERFGMHALPSVLARGFLADCLSLTGDFLEAAVHAGEALEIAEAVGHPYSIMSACGGPAPLHIRRGHLGMAIPLLERAVARCRTWGIGIWFPTIAAELALAYAMVGRIAEALALLDEVGGEVTTPATIAADLSQAFLLVGRVDTATALAESSLATSRRRNERGNVASVLHVLGDIAAQSEPPDVDMAMNFYEQAMRQATDLCMRPLVAHCHLGLGKLYCRTDKREQAEEHLATATTMYREMGMTYWLEKAEAEMRELG